jgi:hypothetical protein
VVPAVLTSANGEEHNLFPFGVPGGIVPTQRYQQVFAAGELTDCVPSMPIAQILFRLDGRLGRPFSASYPHVTICLSTTGASPDGLSQVFAENIGLDEMIVYEGPLFLSSMAGGPHFGPRDFDIVIELQRPFAYDPSAGNLLLDIRRLGSSADFVFFDGTARLGDAVSRVYSDPRDANGAFAPAGFADTFGLATRFVASPEPPAWLLLIVGGAGLAGLAFRARHGRTVPSSPSDSGATPGVR